MISKQRGKKRHKHCKTEQHEGLISFFRHSEFCGISLIFIKGLNAALKKQNKKVLAILYLFSLSFVTKKKTTRCCQEPKSLSQQCLTSSLSLLETCVSILQHRCTDTACKWSHRRCGITGNLNQASESQVISG